MSEVREQANVAAEAEKKVQEKNWAEIDDDEGDDDGDDQEIGIQDKDKKNKEAQKEQQEVVAPGKYQKGIKPEEKKGPVVASNLPPRAKNERGDYVVTSINIADRQTKKDSQLVR